jgi:hypothetical protein
VYTVDVVNAVENGRLPPMVVVIVDAGRFIVVREPEMYCVSIDAGRVTVVVAGLPIPGGPRVGVSFQLLEGKESKLEAYSVFLLTRNTYLGNIESAPEFQGLRNESGMCSSRIT